MKLRGDTVSFHSDDYVGLGACFFLLLYDICFISLQIASLFFIFIVIDVYNKQGGK